MVTLAMSLGLPQKVNYVKEGARETSAIWQKTSTSFNDIQIHSEVTFNHEILHSPSRNPQQTFSTVVTGHLDHVVGCIIPTKVTAIWHRCHFQSLLVIVEAKTQCAVGTALPQLLIYLASLCQAWVQQC